MLDRSGPIRASRALVYGYPGVDLVAVVRLFVIEWTVVDKQGDVATAHPFSSELLGSPLHVAG